MKQIEQTWFFTVDCPKTGMQIVRVNVFVNGDTLPHEITEAVKGHVRVMRRRGRPCEHCRKRHRPKNLKKSL